MSLEASLFAQAPFYHTKLNDSLEKIAFKEKQTHSNSLVEKIFSTKTEKIYASIKAILEEIKLREKLDIHLLNKINNNICSQSTQLSQLNNIQSHYVFEWQTEINNQKSKLEKNILELEKEKRQEYLECWRDLMLLKKYLLSALKDFWDLRKKQTLLS